MTMENIEFEVILMLHIHIFIFRFLRRNHLRAIHDDAFINLANLRIL